MSFISQTVIENLLTSGSCNSSIPRNCRYTGGDARFIEICLTGRYGPLEDNYQQRIPKDNLEVGLFQITKGTQSLASFEHLLPGGLFSNEAQTPLSTDLLEAILVYCTRLRSLNDYVPPFLAHPTPQNSLVSYTDRFMFKLIGLIGQIASSDSSNQVQLAQGVSSEAPLPPYSLQPIILDLSELVLAKLPLSTTGLRRLIINLSAGILHFQPTMLEILFQFIVSQLTLRLIKTEWYEESSETLQNKVSVRGAGLGEIVIPIFRAIATRFENLDDVLETLPSFKGWLTALNFLIPDSVCYGLQYLLTQSGLHLKLVFQLIELIIPSWVGHSLAVPFTPLFSSNGNSHNPCSYIPYLTQSSEYLNCDKCNLRISKSAFFCLSCQSHCHFDCFFKSEIGFTSDNGMLFSLSLDDGREFSLVSTYRTEICSKCNLPLWGTCLQAYRDSKSKKLFHLDCISDVSPPSKFPLMDFLLSKDAKPFTSPEEYLILQDYLEMQVVLVQNSPHHKVVDTLSDLKGAEVILSRLAPPDHNSNELSSIYSYKKLLLFLNNLIESGAKANQNFCNLWNHSVLIEKISEFLDCHGFTSQIVLNHLVMHGLLAFKPILNEPINANNWRFYLPFPISPSLHQDYDINLRVLARCFDHRDPVVNEYGFLLNKKLAPLNNLPDPIPDRLIRTLVEWVLDEDLRLSELKFNNNYSDWIFIPTVLNPNMFSDHYRTMRRQLINKYLLPELVQLQSSLGEVSFADRIYTQLVLVYLARNLEKNLKPSTSITALSAQQYEGLLYLILRWRDLGLPEDLIGLLLDKWAGPFLESLERLPPRVDARILTRRLLVDRIAGIILIKCDFDSSSTSKEVFTLHSESFLYTGALRSMRKSDLSIPLSWLRLFSIAQVLVPDLKLLVPQLLDHVSLDLPHTVDLLSFVFHQMVLCYEAGNPSYSSIMELTTFAARATKSPISDFLADPGVVASPGCQALVELGVAISLLSAGILPPTPKPFTLSHLPLQFIPQISLILSSDEIEHNDLRDLEASSGSEYLSHGNGSVQLLLALSMSSPPSKVHLPLQALKNLKASPTFLSDSAFLNRLWYLLNPAHVLLGTVALDMFFQAGSISVTGLLETIQLKPNASFDERWTWLDSAFGFLACLTSSRARKHPDAWQFIGPLFSTFVGFSLALQESLRTKFETLVCGFEASVLKNLFQFWEIYFDSSKLEQKIVICRQMLQLHTLFPHWQVVQWRSLIGLLSLTLNRNYDEPTKYVSAAFLAPAQHPELIVASSHVTLKVLVITLCFQLLSSGLNISKRELFTLKFLMARALGFTGAQLDTQEGDCVVIIPPISFNHDDSNQMLLVQTFLSQFKLLLDGRVVMQEEKPVAAGSERSAEPTGTTKQPGSMLATDMLLLSALPTSSLMGEQFIDLFFKIVNSNILSRPVSEPLLGEILECAMILIYKYDLDRPTVVDTATPFLRRLTLLLTSTLPDGLTLSLLNLCYVTLRRAPQIAQLILASQVLVIAPLAAKPLKEDPIVVQARRFLKAAFSAYATNGLFMLIFKNYDYEKNGNTLFVALKHVLVDEITGNTQGRPIRSNLSLDAVPPLDRPLFDVINRLHTLPSSEHVSFAAVTANAARYVQQVHSSHYGETLLTEYVTSFLPKLARHIADWPPSQLDLSPIYKMTAIIIRNHAFAAEAFLSHIKQLLKATVGRFPFQASSLEDLLEAIVYCCSEHEGREHSVEFGTVILDEFAAALVRQKPRTSPYQIYSLCQVLFHQPSVSISEKTIPVGIIFQGQAEQSEQQEPVEPLYSKDNSLDVTLLRLAQASKLYLVFQEIPTALFVNMVYYLDDFTRFPKQNPFALEAGLWGGHLLASLFLLKEVPLSVIQNWINGIDVKQSVLAATWFFLMLAHISDADHLETLVCFQPHIIRIILDGLAQPVGEEFGANTLSFIMEDSTSLSFANALGNGQYLHQGQLTRLTMLLIQVWGSLFPKVDSLVADIQSIELECDDPFTVTSLQASFWFTVWPAILTAVDKNSGSANLINEPSNRNASTLPPNLVALLFAHVVGFLSQCQATIPSPHLYTSEWSAFFSELSEFDPRLATDPIYRLAQGVLNGEAIALPFNNQQRIYALLKDLNNIISPW